MTALYMAPEFEVVRDGARCVNCRVCERECAAGVHRPLRPCFKPDFFCQPLR